jgi:NAD+ synthase (glutamine-hydrolysing)
MKITIAQQNPVVGDLEGNVKKMASALQTGNGQGSRLVIFPELALTGYPPKDLLEKSWFVESCRRALEHLERLTARFPGTGAVVGAPLPTGAEKGKALYNAALLLAGGKTLSHHGKALLPTYDVFDETRYFLPAPRVEAAPFQGEALGLSICEDAWNDPDLWGGRLLYDRDPIAELAAGGATLMINIAASPFHYGKEELRFDLARRHARRHRLPFVYVNQVGANDELIFDGGSLAVGPDGEPLALCPFFREHLETLDIKAPGREMHFAPRDPVAMVHDALVLGIRDYLGKCGFTKAVVGLSGGIDSALTCCLAVKALGRRGVLGITMPSPFSSRGSVDDSRALAQNLGIDFQVIPIAPLYEAYLAALREAMAGTGADETEENLQARIRGNILMAFSNKFGCLVLSTGNKSEMSVGYCTLYGDMSGGLSVLADVPKTMVYRLADHINRKQPVIPRAIIEKAPSAELKPDQRDSDTLPPYEVLDAILQGCIEEGMSLEELLETKKFPPETVRWVVNAVMKNEYKRYQAAPGLKVTPKAFGSGRRMPIAARLRLPD